MALYQPRLCGNKLTSPSIQRPYEEVVNVFQNLSISGSSIENLAAIARNPVEENNTYPDKMFSDTDVFTFSALFPWEETKKVTRKCEDKSLCKKCSNKQRNYYDYYIQMKDKEYYTMYPKGKCTLPKGTVLHFTGASDMKREDIREALGMLDAKIQFIDFQKGNNAGWVRLSFPDEARIIIKKMAGRKLKIGDGELVFRVLSGKEETRYLDKVIEDIYEVHQKRKNISDVLKKHGYKCVKNIT